MQVIVYELIHTPAVRMNAGVGVNWLADAIGAEAGVNLTGGIEWRVTENWFSTGNLDVGTLGASELLHGRATIGRQFEQFEWFLGFDYYSLGSEEIRGAMAGLQFRF